MIEIDIKERKVKNKVILRDIKFTICRGEIVGLVGENGAGKSSIMKIITGLTKNFNGSVKYNGMPINDNLVFSSFIEFPKFIEKITGKDNIDYFSVLANRKISSSLKDLMKFWEFDKHMDKKVKSYSLGTKQKLGLIITFLFDRPYLIIDEPTNGMDDESRRVFFEYLKELQSNGIGILISSHNLNELNEICDRIIKVKDGTIEDDNYSFAKLITINIPEVDIEYIKSYFNIVNVEKNDITLEYCDDFIKKLSIISSKYQDIDLISINNYYRRNI